MKIETTEFIRSAHASADFPRDGRPEVAFVGRSNVGKSSLLNRLLGRRSLARISSTPGRTRAINYFLINRRFYFVDLPGYGYAKVGKEERRRWAELIEDYFGHTATGTPVVLLVDGKVGATGLDVEAYRYLLDVGVDVIVVATKIDRLSRGKRAAGLAGIRRTLGIAQPTRLIPVSASTGEGLKELWRELELRL